jgi:hypothetical protein
MGLLLGLFAVTAIIGTVTMVYRAVLHRKSVLHKTVKNHRALLDTMHNIRILCMQNREIAPELSYMITHEIDLYHSQKEITS